MCSKMYEFCHLSLHLFVQVLHNCSLFTAIYPYFQDSRFQHNIMHMSPQHKKGFNPLTTNDKFFLIVQILAPQHPFSTQITNLKFFFDTMYRIVDTGCPRENTSIAFWLPRGQILIDFKIVCLYE